LRENRSVERGLTLLLKTKLRAVYGVLLSKGGDLQKPIKFTEAVAETSQLNRPIELT
jgi:hypothetical protein